MHGLGFGCLRTTTDNLSETGIDFKIDQKQMPELFYNLVQKSPKTKPV